MVLAVDIGNSNIVLGGYENGSLAFSTRFATDRKLEADQFAVEIRGLLHLYEVDKSLVTDVVISSVVPGITSLIAGALRHIVPVNMLFLKNDTASGVKIDIDNPAELGADILASAISAKNRYEMPCVIIDMGTATTMTAMDKNGTIQGVAIMPGVYIAQDALKMHTSQLHGISLEAPAKAIGRNTADSMKSGAVFGNAAMLDGMIDRFAEELGEVKTIVATGGAARKVVACCRHNVRYEPDLLLDGLYQYYLRNKQL